MRLTVIVVNYIVLPQYNYHIQLEIFMHITASVTLDYMSIISTLQVGGREEI